MTVGNVVYHAPSNSFAFRDINNNGVLSNSVAWISGNDLKGFISVKWKRDRNRLITTEQLVLDMCMGLYTDTFYIDDLWLIPVYFSSGTMYLFHDQSRRLECLL